VDRAHGESKEGGKMDRLLREAFDASDEQLLRDFLLAQTEIKDSEIPPNSEHGFADLVGKIEKRGVKPYPNCGKKKIETARQE
jgi:hypothetical protein